MIVNEVFLDRWMTILHLFCIFCHFLLIVFLLVFLANTFKNCKFELTIYNTMLRVFCICLHCLLFMERFVCNLCAYSAYLQYMEDTGRSKMRQ